MDQLQKIESLGLANQYYEICAEHPLRIGEAIEKMPARDVLDTAANKIDITRLKGPGSCYEVQGLPESVLLRFIIQSRTSIETHFELASVNEEHVGSFATLCLASKESAGKKLPDPPYPRPEAHSLSELIEVFMKLKKLALEIDRAIQ